ncbi:MAG: T9SS type A sorting domain-containing protein [Candidatus Eisenbacteria bacterium]|nr:T9SS type A sorting domain-containing protein [Candidatus Eisenbacteria bacterium]
MRESDVTASQIAFRLIPLGAGESSQILAAAGSADSLRFQAEIWAGDFDFTLIDPVGRVVDPDTAAIDPNVDYYEDALLMSYTVASSFEGEWSIVVDASQSADSALAAIKGIEYSPVFMRIGFDDVELEPSETQRIESVLEWNGQPILDAEVTGILIDPQEIHTDLSLLDDGTNGDLVPNDGIYTAEILGNQRTGQYMVHVHAGGIFGIDQVLNRDGSGVYFVAERPDLELLASDIELIPSTIDDQLKISVNMEFRNNGAAYAESVLVQVIEEETYIVFSESLFVNVAPGQELSLSTDWDVRFGIAEARLGGLVNTLGNLSEFNLVDNEAYATLPLSGVEHENDLEEPQPSTEMPTEKLALRVFPNPFTNGTTIQYVLPRSQDIDLAVFDISGRRVRQLKKGMKVPGQYSVLWDSRNDNGQIVASGIYFARLRTGRHQEVNKLMFLR